MSKNLSFEKSLQELESIVSRLEKGDLSLEESLQQFEKGMGLSKECQQALEEAELKIQTITQAHLPGKEEDHD